MAPLVYAYDLDKIPNTTNFRFQKCLCLDKNTYHPTYDKSLVPIIISISFGEKVY